MAVAAGRNARARGRLQAAIEAGKALYRNREAVGNMAQQGANAANAAVAEMRDLARRMKRQQLQSKPNVAPRARQLQQTNAPTSMGFSGSAPSFVMKNVTKESVRMTGRTILGFANAPAVPGSNLPFPAVIASLNPVTFSDRMGTQASLYDKYVYHKAVIRYLPACGTATAGVVIIALDRDYSDPPETQSFAAAASYEGAVWGPVWQAATSSYVRDRNEKRTYFMNAIDGVDIRETEQFKAYCFGVNVASSVAMGTFVLDYDIELISPVFAPVEVLISGFTSVVSGPALTLPATSSVALIPLAPANNVGTVWECFVVGAYVGTSAILIGAGGAIWAPGVLGCYRIFVTATNAASLTMYLTFSAATGGSGYALYNSGAGTLPLFASGYTLWYRKVAGPAPTTG